MKPYRLARVAEAVREVASETILYELHDPRVKQVTVTRAEVSGDLQHAKVYVSIMGSDKEQSLTMKGLRHAAGFIQSKLARRLETRFTPVVTFVLDQGVKNSIEMTRLINEALSLRDLRRRRTPREKARRLRRRTPRDRWATTRRICDR